MENTGNIDQNMLLSTPFNTNNELTNNITHEITNKGTVDYEPTEFTTAMTKIFIILLSTIGVVLGIYLCVLVYNKYKRKKILETVDLVGLDDSKRI